MRAITDRLRVCFNRRSIGIPMMRSRALHWLRRSMEPADWKQAKAEYEKVLVVDPTDANARFDLGQLEMRHEDFAAAEANFRQLVADNPDDAGAHAALGAVLTATQRDAEGKQEFETALKLDAEEFRCAL